MTSRKQKIQRDTQVKGALKAELVRNGAWEKSASDNMVARKSQKAGLKSGYFFSGQSPREQSQLTGHATLKLPSRF